MPEKRSLTILNYIKQKQSVKLRELCQMFPDFNEMTIRRDLNLLEKNGYIVRTHGGARICEEAATDFYHYGNRSALALEEKRQIGVKAAQLLEPNMSVYLDAGTTNLEFAKIMPDIPLSVITNMPSICLELSQKKHVDVILTGGTLNKSVLSVSGPMAIQSLLDVNIDVAFMGAAGFTVETGFSNALINECALKRQAISCASSVVMLIDSTKVGKVRQFTFAKLAEVGTVICEKPFDDATKEALAQHDVRCL